MAVTHGPWPNDPPPPDGLRRLDITWANTIAPRLVRWLWDDRIALGTISLLAGREGLGKSTLAYWVAARITKGDLPGDFYLQPRPVLIAATEDSWEHTIVPRLIAAGADTRRVGRIDVTDPFGHAVPLSMPNDLDAVGEAVLAHQVALILLDPLMSRLNGKLDTHRDADVRRALEPLADLTARTGCSALGLIHHNKAATTDPLNAVMGSKAFTAVARSVHTVLEDPDDDEGNTRLFGTIKNNLGRTDVDTLTFSLHTHHLDTQDGPAPTSKVVFGEPRRGRIADAMRRTYEQNGDKTATADAADWLKDYIASQGGQVASADVKKAARGAGHTEKVLRLARERLGVATTSVGFPRRTYWELDVTQLPLPTPDSTYP